MAGDDRVWPFSTATAAFGGEADHRPGAPGCLEMTDIVAKVAAKFL
jgi:hypothetical protein